MAKFALVTGASSGIGYNLSIELSKKGYTVFGCAPQACVQDMDPLKQYGVIPFALDITKIEEIKKAVEFFKETSGGETLDILYNNAGISIGGPGFDFLDEEAANFMNVNLMGHIYMTKYFVQFVINAKGTILYTASVAGIIPLCWTSIYCASKAGINAYARGIRAELEPFGVTVISVITGGVYTNIAGHSEETIKSGISLSRMNVPGFKESIISANEMVNDGMPPEIYAKKIVDRLENGFKGFNIYEGFKAGTLKFVADWVPLWLQYKVLAIRFKQNVVLENVRKQNRKKSA